MPKNKTSLIIVAILILFMALGGFFYFGTASLASFFGSQTIQFVFVPTTTTQSTIDYDDNALIALGLRKLSSDEFAVITTKTGKKSGSLRKASLMLSTGQIYTVESDQTTDVSVIESKDNLPVYIPNNSLDVSIHTYDELDDRSSKVDQGITRKLKKQNLVPVIVQMNLPFGKYYEKGDSLDRINYKKGQFNSAKIKITPLLRGNSKIKRDLQIINSISVDVDESSLNALTQSPLVKKIELDREVKALLDTSLGDIYAKEVWQLFDAQNNNITGKGQIIAVIDTGVDYHQPAFGSCVSMGPTCKVIGGYDFVNKDNDPMDDQGHGTHVAATAAGKDMSGATQLYGVAPDANIIAYKVLGAEGSGYGTDIIAAINAASDPNGDGNSSDHVSVGTMSLGGSGSPDDPMALAVDNSSAVGVTWTIAAGNSGGVSTIGSPGTARTAITVAAACKSSQIGANSYCSNPIASFSSRGPLIWNGVDIQKPDIAAPGVYICAARWDSAFSSAPTCFDSSHIRISGTSMATPHVAGAVALVRQAHPEYTPAQVKQLLKQNARDLGGGMTYNDQGAGEINLKAVIPFSTQVNSFPSFWNITSDPTQKTNTNSQTFSITSKNSSITNLNVSFNLSIPGITTSLSKTVLSVANLSTDSFSATINIDNDQVQAGSYIGSIVLSDSSGTKGIIYINVSVKTTFSVTPLSQVDYGIDAPDLSSWTSESKTFTITNLRKDAPQTFNLNSSAFASGITYQISPATITIPSGSSATFATNFVVNNASVKNGTYSGTVTIKSSTSQISVPIQFLKYYKLIIQELTNPSELNYARGYLIGPSGTIDLGYGSPKIVYLSQTGTYTLILNYNSTFDMDTGVILNYRALNENVQVVSGVNTVNVSRSDAKNKVKMVATDPSGVTHDKLQSWGRWFRGPGLFESSVGFCWGSPNQCDISTYYYSNISTKWQVEEFYTTPSFQAEKNVAFYGTNLSGLSGDLTVTNNASDFPSPIVLQLDTDEQSGNLLPLIMGPGGAASEASKVLPVPITQNLYSLLPNDSQHYYYYNDSISSQNVVTPDFTLEPLQPYSWLNMFNDSSVPARIPYPNLSTNKIYSGLGPSFYIMKMANEPTSVKLLSYYSQFKSPSMYGLNNAFVRQDYTNKNFAGTTYNVYQNGLLVGSGIFSRLVYGSNLSYTTTLPQAGLAELRVDNFSYMDHGVSLVGKVDANFNTSLADPNPPAIKRLYYFSDNERSEVYDPSVSNRLEFELDPIGGSLNQVSVSYSQDGSTFQPVTVSNQAGIVYSANIPSVSGVSIISIRLMAVDNSNNSLSYTFQLPMGKAPVPDSDPIWPSIPVNLKADSITPTSVNLSWAASTDNIGVVGYRIYRNGAYIGTSAVNSYVDSGLVIVSGYKYTVAAFDAAGNVSAQSLPLSVTTTGTLTSHIVLSTNSISFSAPVMISPAQKGFSVENSGRIILNWKGTTNQSWCHILPSSSSINTSTSQMVGVTVDAQSVVGIYNCIITNSDPAADNSPQVVNVTYQVGSSTSDATPPTVSIISPASGTTYTSASTVTITAQATDNVGVAKVEFYDGNVLKKTSLSAPYNHSWTFSSTNNGTHSWTAKAYDASGNSAVSSPVNLIVNISAIDTTPPSTSITSPSNNAPVSDIVSVNVSASDNVGVAKVELYADGVLIGTDTVTPYAFNWDTNVISDGSHFLQTKAYDSAGNIGSSTIITVNVDNVLPTVSITSPTNGGTVSKRTNVTITASASDNNSVAKVEFYVNSKLQCTDTAPDYSCSWLVPNAPRKAYQIQAKAYDSAGNIGSSQVVTVTSK